MGSQRNLFPQISKASHNGLLMVLGQWFSKYGPQTRGIRVTWELVRNIDSQA